MSDSNFLPTYVDSNFLPTYVDEWLDANQHGKFTFDFKGVHTSLPDQLVSLGATYTRNSLKNVLQDSAFVSLPANQFGTSYDPITGLYAYMPEPVATNLLTHSHDFSNESWTKVQVDLSVGSSSPFGSDTATKITPTAVYAYHFIRNAVSFGSNVMTLQYCIAKADGYKYLAFGRNQSTGTGLVVFNLESGVRVQNSGDYSDQNGIIPLVNGFHLCYVRRMAITTTVRQPRIFILDNNYTSPATDSNCNFVGDGESGIIFAHCQQETGRKPTSPIRTNGPTATRAADVITVPLTNITGFSDSAYTLSYDGRQDTEQLSLLRSAISMTDGGTDNRVYMVETTSNTYQLMVISDGVEQANVIEGVVVIDRHKRAASLLLNNLVSSTDGATGGSDATVLMPVALTTLEVGHHLNASQFNGYIYSVTLYTRALTQAQLNAITS